MNTVNPKFITGIMGKAGAGKDTVANYIISRINFSRKYSFADSLKTMCSEVFDIPTEWMYDQDLKKKTVTINFNTYTKIEMRRWVFHHVYQNPKWQWVVAKPELSGQGDGRRYTQVADTLLQHFENILRSSDDKVSVQYKEGCGTNYTLTIRLMLQLMGTEIIRNNIGDSFWAEIKEDVSEEENIVVPDCRFETELDYVLSHEDSLIILVKNPDLDCSATEGHSSEELVDNIDEYFDKIGKTYITVYNNLSGNYDSLYNDIDKLVLPNIKFETKVEIKWQQ